MTSACSAEWSTSSGPMPCRPLNDETPPKIVIRIISAGPSQGEQKPPATGRSRVVGSVKMNVVAPFPSFRSVVLDTSVPQQLLDLSVSDAVELATQRDRALSLGATLLDDRSADSNELLYVFADPAGHPFCIFVVSPS